MGKPLSARNLFAVSLLVIAMMSPVMQMGWYAQTLIQTGSPRVLQTSTDITTYEGLPLEKTENFVCPEPEDTFFFTVLAKG